MQPIEDVLEKLEKVVRSGQGYAAYCPSHGDTTSRHLTINEAKDGRVLLYCHKGCTFLEVMNSLGMDPKEAFPRPVKDGDTWLFHNYDKQGNFIATHHRRKTKDGKKRMWWSTEAGNGLDGAKTTDLPLWGNEAVSGVSEDEPIVVVEGEKPALLLMDNNIPAVGTVTGASSTPDESVLAVLKDRRVILWPDNDEEGYGHMERIGTILLGIAKEVRLFTWADAPHKADAADYLAIRRRDAEAVEVLWEELVASPLFEPKRRHKGLSSSDFLQSPYFKWVTDNEDVGIGTGIPRLDKHILGLAPGRSYVIAGAPGDGKSLFCGQISLTAAWQKKRVCLFSIESSALEYVQRLTCYMAGVDYFEAMAKNTSDEERQKLYNAFEELRSLPWLICDAGIQTPSFIRDQVEKNQPDLVIVDYLQYATADNPSGNRVEDLDAISREVTALKSDYNIPLLLAEQINRDGRSVNKEPELHSLRGSGGLEQDADVVMFLHRKTKEDGELSEDTKLLCRKNRITKRFIMDFNFVDGQQWFVDATDKPFQGGRVVGRDS